MLPDSWYYGDISCVQSILGSADLRIRADLNAIDNGSGNYFAITINGDPDGTFNATVWASGSAETTDEIDVGATALEVQTAIRALSNVGPQGASVTSSAANTYTVYLVGGLGADAAVTDADGSFTGGTSPTISLSATVAGLGDAQIILVVSDGQTADALIDSQIDGGAYKVPLVYGGLTPAQISDPTNRMKVYMRRVSGLQTAILLNEHNAIQYVGRGETDVAKLFNGYQAKVDAMLSYIKDGTTILNADPSDPASGPRLQGGAVLGLIKAPSSVPGWEHQYPPGTGSFIPIPYRTP